MKKKIPIYNFNKIWLAGREFASVFDQQIWNNKLDSIKTGIPALLYTIQNNLIYLAISNLDAAVFQVTFQIKILTTALFTVILLNRSLKITQWISLFILFVGISIIQIQNVKSSDGNADAQKNALFGLMCVISACVLSGLAGVYFEKILKNSKTSIWVRNIQLGRSKLDQFNVSLKLKIIIFKRPVWDPVCADDGLWQRRGQYQRKGVLFRLQRPGLGEYTCSKCGRAACRSGNQIRG